jgi:hypothetical protein
VTYLTDSRPSGTCFGEGTRRVSDLRPGSRSVLARVLIGPVEAHGFVAHRGCVSNESNIPQAQHEIVDQREQVRDPADDSGEADDPTAVVDAYPKAFDDKIEEAEAAIATDDTAGGRSRSDGPLPN